MSCGGGRYRSPVERDPRRVTKDVREGSVSRARAADVYGVATDDRGDFDEIQTGRLRRARILT